MIKRIRLSIFLLSLIFTVYLTCSCEKNRIDFDEISKTQLLGKWQLEKKGNYPTLYYALNITWYVEFLEDNRRLMIDTISGEIHTKYYDIKNGHLLISDNNTYGYGLNEDYTMTITSDNRLKLHLNFIDSNYSDFIYIRKR